MLKNMKRLLGLEKGSSFSTRVIILSLPSAVVFILLSLLNIVSPWISFFCYVIIILFNMFSLLPLSYEMQSLKQYIYSLAGDEKNNPDLKLSEQDAKKIAEAVNSIHRFWASKAESLEAQTMSDAAVLDTLPDPILMLDGEGAVTGSNLSARNLLGEDIVGSNIDSIFNVNIFVASVEKVLKGKSESESLVFHAGGKINKRIYAHISKLP